MSAVKAGAAYVELLIKDGSLTKGLNAASAKLKSFGKGVGLVGGAMTAAGAAIVAPLIAMAGQFASTGDAVEKFAARTGIAAKEVSTLAYAAGQSGSDMATLEGGMRGMAKALHGLSTGSKQQVGMFAALGLSMDDLAGKSPDEQFKLIAEQISKVANPTERAALAMKVFGKAGAALLPMMAGGAAGIEALQAEADRLNLSIDSEAAASAAAYGDAMDNLKQTVAGISMTIGKALAPTLTELANLFSNVAASAIGWARQNAELFKTIFKVGAAIGAAGIVLTAVGGVIIAVGAVLGGLAAMLSAVGVAFGVLVTLATMLLSPIGLVVVAVASLGAYLLWASGAGSKALEWLGSAFGTLKDDAIKAWGAIGKALAAGDIAAAGAVVWSLLKLQWTRGVLFLRNLWADFKDYLKQTASDIVYATAGVFVDGAALVASGWINAIDLLLDTFSVFAAGVKSIWNNTVGWLKKAWVKLRSLIDSDIDVEAEVKAIDGETNAANAGADNTRNQTIADREAKRKKRLAEVNANAAGMKSELGKMASGDAEARAKKRAEEAAQMAGAEADVARAQAEHQAAVDKANAADGSPTAPAPRPDIPEMPEMPEIDFDEIETPEIEIPEIELSTDSADSMDSFGEGLSDDLSDVTAGFDGLGMGFGGSAMQNQLDNAVASLAVDPAITATAGTVPAQIQAATIAARSPESMAKTASLDAMQSSGDAMPDDARRAILETANSSRELLAVARRSGVRFL